VSSSLPGLQAPPEVSVAGSARVRRTPPSYMGTGAQQGFILRYGGASVAGIPGAVRRLRGMTDVGERRREIDQVKREELAWREELDRFLRVR
jgi:hypothetical protein